MILSLAYDAQRVLWLGEMRREGLLISPKPADTSTPGWEWEGSSLDEREKAMRRTPGGVRRNCFTAEKEA